MKYLIVDAEELSTQKGDSYIKLYCRNQEDQKIYVLNFPYHDTFYVEMNDRGREWFRKYHYDCDKTEECLYKSMYGYSEHPQKFMKIETRNRKVTKEITQDATMLFYEVHVNLLVKFFVEHKLGVLDEIEINRTVQPITWFQLSFENVVDSINKQVISKPHLMYYDIECLAPKPGVFPEAKRGHPIFQISCVIVKEDVIVHECVLCWPETPGFQWYRDEREMLIAFKEVVLKHDPDGLVGYNSNGFDLPYILDRMEILQIESNFSRDPRSMVTKREAQSSSRAKGTTVTWDFQMAGRFAFDIMLCLRANSYLKLRSFKLEDICQKYLKKGKDDVPPNQMPILFKTVEGRIKIAKYCLQDSKLLVELEAKRLLVADMLAQAKLLHITPKAKIQRGLIYQVFSKLHHYTRQMGFLIPTFSDVTRPEVIEFQGATVLEPRVGYFKDPVCVLDFESLYPSIIRSYNLDYTTLVLDKKWALENPDKVNVFTDHENQTEYIFVKQEIHKGILQYFLADLIQSRKEARANIEKFPDEAAAWNAIQAALKVCANSAYGACGAKLSVVPCLEIAAATTFIGRTNLQLAKKYVTENYSNVTGAVGLEVIYGDSVTGDTPGVFKIGNRLVVMAPEDFEGTWLRLREPSPQVRASERDGKREREEKVNTMTSPTLSAAKTLSALSNQKDMKPLVESTKFLKARMDSAAMKHSNHNIPQDDYKEYLPLTDVCVWTECGWTQVKRLIRHVCKKPIVRVKTVLGVVHCTEDHSLVTKQGEASKPRTGLNLLQSIPLKNYGDDMYDSPSTFYTMHRTLPRLEIPYGRGIRDTLTNRLYETPYQAALKVPVELFQIQPPRFRQEVMWRVIVFDQELACVLGWFHRYGSCGVDKCGRCYWIMSISSQDISTQVQRILLGIAPNLKFHFMNNMLSLFVDSAALDFISWFSCLVYDPHHRKRIPSQLFHAPTRTQLIYLDALSNCEKQLCIGEPRFAQSIVLLYYFTGSRSVLVNEDDNGNYTLFPSDQEYEAIVNEVEVMENKVSGDTKRYVYDYTTENHHFQAGVGSLIVHNTDSIFCLMPGVKGEDAVSYGKMLSVALRENVFGDTECIKMAYEKVFAPFIQVTAKHYCGWKFVETPEDGAVAVTGLQMIKRDSAKMLKRIGDDFLEYLLCKHDEYLAEKFLVESIKSLFKSELALDDFVITKKLGKLKTEYKNVPAHLIAWERQVARKDDVGAPQIGDMFDYVLVKPQQGNEKADCIVDLELAKRTNILQLNLDVLKYFEKFIKKPLGSIIDAVYGKQGVSRILNPNRYESQYDVIASRNNLLSYAGCASVHTKRKMLGEVYIPRKETQSVLFGVQVDHEKVKAVEVEKKKKKKKKKVQGKVQTLNSFFVKKSAVSCESERERVNIRDVECAASASQALIEKFQQNENASARENLQV